MKKLLSITWDFNPELVNIFGIEIRWYGLLWTIGLLSAMFIVHKIYQIEKHPQKWFDYLYIYIIVGLIVGARLGHCLFYNPVYYLTHPLEILMTRNGGLASHGGVIGILIGTWLYSRKIHQNMLWVLDRIATPAGLTGSCIRVGNFLNSEVYGKPADLPWGVNFVRDPMWKIPIEYGGSNGLPAHPTQLYEAFLYLIVFAITMFLFWKTDAKKKQGLIFGICIFCVFTGRFLLEYLKNIQEPFEQYLRNSIGMDMGQLLSIPLILAGIYFIVSNTLKRKSL